VQLHSAHAIYSVQSARMQTPSNLPAASQLCSDCAARASATFTALDANQSYFVSTSQALLQPPGWKLPERLRISYHHPDRPCRGLQLAAATGACSILRYEAPHVHAYCVQFHLRPGTSRQPPSVDASLAACEHSARSACATLSTARRGRILKLSLTRWPVAARLARRRRGGH
jgi:hypothetical protein